jgi:antitoxin VapB
MYIPQGYAMTDASIFKSNKSQAVRLPKSVALPEHVRKVQVIKQGQSRLLVPAGGSWAQFFASDPIDADFLSDRKQPVPQERRPS